MYVRMHVYAYIKPLDLFTGPGPGPMYVYIKPLDLGLAFVQTFICPFQILLLQY